VIETKETAIQPHGTGLMMSLQLPVTNIFHLPLITRSSG